MLTYEKIGNPETELFNCCSNNPGGEMPGGDCCNDQWKQDLVQVTADWKKASAHATQVEAEYGFALEWKNQLKAWFSDWEITDEKTDALCRQLGLFITHLEKVCFVTSKTSEAIEILLCMAEDLYVRVDKLKIKYDQLRQCIDGLKRPELASGTGVVKYIEEYGVKLDSVIATRDGLIEKIVLALEMSYGLNISLCEQYGLKEVLIYWKKKFKCVSNGNDNCGCNDNEPQQQQQQYGQVEHSNDKKHCKLEPKISFPLDEDNYYTDLQQEYEQAKSDAESLKEEMYKAKEQRDALLACKESLEKAILEVDNKCK